MVHPPASGQHDTPGQRAVAAVLRSILARYAAIAAAGLALAGMSAVWLVPDGSIAGVIASMGTYMIAALLAGAGLARTYPHRELGLANGVTLLRLALAASLMAALVDPFGGARTGAEAWAVVLVAAVALGLDGVDGRLARRQRLTSRFGARFDMEVDAILAALLSLLLLQSGKVGGLVLILGFLRYGFVLASGFLPWLRAPLPERLRRKAICVIQIGALLALLSPVFDAGTAGPIAAVVTIALVWSFALDLHWLWRRRS